MARRIRVKSGDTTAEISNELANSIERALKELAPESLQVIENAIDQIYEEARKEWPVRYHKKRSKDSKGKLERGITLDVSDGSIYGYIRNSAEYAWAIKVGKNTRINLPLGARVSNELLWKPLRKQADPIAKAVADEIEKQLKRK